MGFDYFFESLGFGGGRGRRADLVECEDLQSRAFGMAPLGLFARRPLCGRFRSRRLLVFVWIRRECSRP